MKHGNVNLAPAAYNINNIINNSVREKFELSHVMQRGVTKFPLSQETLAHFALRMLTPADERNQMLHFYMIKLINIRKRRTGIDQC